MPETVSDDKNVEITCPECEKDFVIQSNQMGEMVICPHCNTILTAQPKE